MACRTVGPVQLAAQRQVRVGDVDLGSGAVESSLWPLVLGVGIMLVANGFVLGLWLLVPGLALVLRGLVGMVTERPSPSR